MTDKDALELQNMFTTAAQLAKSRNKFDSKFEIKEADLIELLKKAFPNMKNETNTISLAKSILKNR